MFRVFKASFMSNKDMLTGLFKVTKSLKDANKWTGFKPEEHKAGSAVKWALKHVVLVPVTPLRSEKSSASSPPTLLEEPRKKRSPEKWIKQKQKNCSSRWKKKKRVNSNT